MSKKVAVPLLTLFAYTLVLVHGIMPHQHLHQAANYAQQHHSHDSQHHSHDHEEPDEKESPFSHYFHSAVQGEPHLSHRNSSSFVASQASVKSEGFIFILKAFFASREPQNSWYAIGYSPPTYHAHLPQRGPPSA